MSKISKLLFIHPSAFLPLILMLIIFPEYHTLLGLLALIIHELGHIAVILLFGFSIDKISVMTGGLEIRMKYPPSRRLHKTVIAWAGCFANLSSAVIAYLISFFLPNLKPYSDYFVFYSMIMCIFNTLPIKGLDGGEVAEQLFDRFFLPDTVYNITKSLSLIFTFFLWVFACYILFMTNSNISLFIVCVVLFCSLLKG